jgi:hypothetical protein
VVELLTDLRVRHVRQTNCPGAFVDVVVDVAVQSARDVRGHHEVLDAGVAVPAPLPRGLLAAFIDGVVATAAEQPALSDHDVTITLKRPHWHPVTSTPRSTSSRVTSGVRGSTDDTTATTSARRIPGRVLPPPPYRHRTARESGQRLLGSTTLN